ncbi:GtrA family protein [Nocardia sp. NPDC051981]|uniref:GtrA family protein n=1 Tax=Nocardia sp. NPDC051981 TaxID=3155417 RepID=UPI00343109FC
MNTTADLGLRYLRGDHVFAQLIRFALVGGASNITYLVLFLTLNSTGPLIANIAGSILSTVIANELHRHLTFRAAGRVTWFTAQWEGGGLAVIGLLISSAALAALDSYAPGLSPLARAAAVIALTAAIGALRFLALRGFVFGSPSTESRAELEEHHSTESEDALRYSRPGGDVRPAFLMGPIMA